VEVVPKLGGGAGFTWEAAAHAYDGDGFISAGGKGGPPQ
jgi:hypothetical protein